MHNDDARLIVNDSCAARERNNGHTAPIIPNCLIDVWSICLCEHCRYYAELNIMHSTKKLHWLGYNGNYDNADDCVRSSCMVFMDDEFCAVYAFAV